MSDPTPSLFIAFAYVVFCYVAPRVLKGRSFAINKYIRVYNLVMVVYSIYIPYELYKNTIGYQWDWLCQPMDHSSGPRSMAIAAAIWHYYFTKIIELLDSVFFILRGKYNQLTFLHVFHHSTMVMLGWIMANFVPGGSSVFSASMNTDIHVVMYTYYFLASFGPKMQKYLWWKKYLTRIQIAQFFINLAICLYIILNPIQCDWPIPLTWLAVGLNTSYMILFLNFYTSAYNKKNKKLQWRNILNCNECRIVCAVKHFLPKAINWLIYMQ